MFGMGKGLGKRRGNRMHGGRHGRNRRAPVNLNGAIPGNQYIVKFNPDKKPLKWEFTQEVLYPYKKMNSIIRILSLLLENLVTSFPEKPLNRF